MAQIEIDLQEESSASPHHRGKNCAFFVDFLKFVIMMVAVEMIAESWEEISASTLCNSWRKIAPMQAADSRSIIKRQDDDNNEFVCEF